MNPPEPLYLLLLGLPILYVSVFIHELGHAIFGHAAGFVITSMGVGAARSLVVIPVRSVRVYFGLSLRMQGITFAIMPQIFPAKWRLVAFTAGGMLANGIAALLSLALWWWLPWGHVFWFTAALVNGSLGLANLLPLNVKFANAPVRTDGALILQAIRWGTIATPAPMTIQTVAALRGLFLSIGDTQILQFFLWAAAGAWSQLDNSDRATALCAEADALPVSPLPSVRGTGSIVRAGVAIEGGRSEDAVRSLESAEADFRAEGHNIGLFLVSLGRATARVVCGDAEGGAADLDILRADPLLVRHPELHVAVLMTRLRAAIAMADPAAMQRLLSEYDAIGRVPRSAARDYQVDRSVARFHLEQGDPSNAEPAYRRALAAVGELAGMWADPNERSSFLQARSALLEEARRCAESLDKIAEFERLIAMTLDTRTSAAEFAVKRDRRLRRMAFRVTLGNLVVIVAAAVGGLIAPPQTAGPFFLLAFSLIAFTVVGAVYRLFDLVIGRLIPPVRHVGGAVMLLLACCPWYGAVVILLLAFYDSRSW